MEGCITQVDLNGKVAFKVPTDEMIGIESAYYEYNGLLILLSQFGSTTPFKPDMERYEYLVKTYLEAYMTYSMTYNAITSRYVPIEYTECNTSANFELSLIIVDSSDCSCSTKGGKENA